MHLLILPVVLLGLSAKVINNRLKNKTPEKQIDIILASFFTTVTPQHFGEFNEDIKDEIETSTRKRENSY
jgi:hypothetical protein